MARPEKVIYAVYKGDDFICLGSAKECAVYLGIKHSSFRFLLSPAYLKRIENRKETQHALIAYKVDEDY